MPLLLLLGDGEVMKRYLRNELNLIQGIRALKEKIEFKRNNPDFFDPTGTLVFCGAQGYGKTISAVSYIINIANAYPKSILVSNVDIEKSLLPVGYQVIEYTGLDCLKNIENGQLGVIYFIDEIHLELNSLESKNIDIDVMIEISQQRKQRKHIVGTSQVYLRMAKPLREQVKDVVLCRCYFGILQVNKLINAFESYEENGKLHAKVEKTFIWFHTSTLYGAYDTYAKMRRYRNEWKGRPRIIGGEV